MPSLDQQIRSAVGSRPAANRTKDQIVIIDLLQSISTENGGARGRSLPPAGAQGQVDVRVIDAILNFQRQMASNGLMPSRNIDGRVDPNGKTIRLMNRFANFNGGGGGAVPPPTPTPTPPVPPAPEPPSKGAGFLQNLFGKMTPRPTNLRIAGNGSISLAISAIGIVNGFITVADNRDSRPVVDLNMLGAGLSLGPIPFGVEIAPSSFPSKSSQIHAGPRTRTSTLELDDLLGPTLLVAASSSGIGPGFNSTAILFSIGANRSFDTLASDILNAVNPNVAISFLADAFNSCRGWASTAGVFVGVSVGVSLIEVKLLRDNIF